MKAITLLTPEQTQHIKPLSAPELRLAAAAKKACFFLLAYQLALCSTVLLINTSTTTERAGAITMSTPNSQEAPLTHIPYTQTTLCAADNFFLLQSTKFSLSDTSTCYWLTFACLPEAQDSFTSPSLYAFNISIALAFNNGAAFPEIHQIS